MQHPILAPTPRALADLVARCAQINRYTTELTAAEELRIAALASAVVVMRNVLGLLPISAESLPVRQARIAHWSLTGRHLAEVATPRIRELGGGRALVVDEHDQVKILSQRTWRGRWRLVTLWRDGVHDLSSSDLMEYLAALAAAGQQRAPDVARALLKRAQAIDAAKALTSDPCPSPLADAPAPRLSL